MAMTQNDRNFAKPINDRTIAVDCRGMKCTLNTQSGIVKAILLRHVTDGDHPYSLYNQSNKCKAYHMQSVAKKVWVVSLDEMTPQQTQDIATQFLVDTSS